MSKNAAEWHRYLHAEGILVPNDDGEKCGPWHHRVFMGPMAPHTERHASPAALDVAYFAGYADGDAGNQPNPAAHVAEARASAPLDVAVRRFLDTAYPNNGEGHADRLVWMVPESAFGPLREALARLTTTDEGAEAASEGQK